MSSPNLAFRITLLGASLFCWVGSVLAEPEPQYQISPIPSFVETTEIPAGVAGASGEPMKWLLYDYQQDFRISTRFAHYAQRFQSSEAVAEHSQVRISFAPEHETLQLHRVKLHRDGKEIEALIPEQVKVIQREEKLEENIYEGELTAVVFLKDVRVGDVLEYSYSIVGQNESFGSHIWRRLGLQWSIPVEKVNLRILLPPRRTFQHRLLQTDKNIKVVRTPQYTELIWQQEKVPALHFEEHAPDWLDPFPELQVSDTSTWTEVADWATALYQPLINQPLSPELQAKVSEIAKQTDDSRERLKLAASFVQDEVRYLGIELGPNSYVPRAPSQTFASRYGDCKDKSVLLVRMLQGLGIEAAPVLVNTDYSYLPGESLPSPIVFNHVIVEVSLEGKKILLDATGPFEPGPVSDYYVPAYVSGFPVKKGANALIELRSQGNRKSSTQVKNYFRMKNYDAPVSFEVRSVYRGRDATQFRSYWRNIDPAEMSRDYLKFYAASYPKIQAVEPFKITETPDRNEIHVRERYQIEDFCAGNAESGGRECAFYPDLLAKKLPEVKLRERNMPLGIEYPVQFSEEIHVQLPEEWLIENEQDTIDNPWFNFTSRVSSVGTRFVLQYRYQSKVDHVQAKQVPNAMSEVDRIEDQLGYWLPIAGRYSGRIGTPNYLLFLLTGVFSVAALFFTRFLLQVEVGSPTASDVVPQRIGGLLTLLALGVALFPLKAVGVFIEAYGALYSLEEWSLYTSPKGAYFDPRWAPYYMIGIFFAIMELAASVAMFVLCFSRRCSFPKLYTWFLIVGVIYHALDTTALVYISELSGSQALGVFSIVLVSTVIRLSWSVYLLKSKRVRNTFVYPLESSEDSLAADSMNVVEGDKTSNSQSVNPSIGEDERPPRSHL